MLWKGGGKAPTAASGLDPWLALPADVLQQGTLRRVLGSVFENQQWDKPSRPPPESTLGRRVLMRAVSCLSPPHPSRTPLDSPLDQGVVLARGTRHQGSS